MTSNTPVPRNPRPLLPVSGRSVLALLGAWIASSAILGTAAWFATAALTGTASATPTLMTVFLVYLLLPLAAPLVYRPSGIRDRLALRRVTGRTIGLAIAAWAGVMAVVTILYLLYGLLTEGTWAPLLDVIHNSTDYARFGSATPIDWVLIIVRGLFLAGITEESVFRGALFGWLRPKMPWWAVALITAVLFASIHYFISIIPLGIALGILLAWLRERAGSILPGVVIHWLTDWLFFAIAIALWACGQ